MLSSSRVTGPLALAVHRISVMTLTRTAFIYTVSSAKGLVSAMSIRDSLRTWFGPHYPSQIFAVLFAILFGSTLIKLCFVFGETPRAAGENVLLCVLGALAGWIIGLLYSPFSEKEAEHFAFLGKTIAAFVSGYVVSKLDSLIGRLVEKASDHLASVPWDRVGLGVGSCLLAAVVVFVSRIYAHPENQGAEETRTAPNATPPPSREKTAKR